MKRTLAWTWLCSLLLASAALPACDFGLPKKHPGEYCQRDSQCIEGLICLSRRCAAEPAPAEPRPFTDAGPVDAGTDAGPMDAGTDAGPVDAGADAGPGDAGPDDAGPDDAGTDAGTDAG